jgi:hypothetical protein
MQVEIAVTPDRAFSTFSGATPAAVIVAVIIAVNGVDCGQRNNHGFPRDTLSMAAIVTLPDALARRLQKMANERVTSLETIVRRLVSEVVEHYPEKRVHRKEAALPLVPKSKTGMILPVSGKDLDEMFAREHFAS